jgi:hypothetical protein
MCQKETSQSIKHLLFVIFTAQNVSNKLKSHFKIILNFLTTSILSEIVLIEGRIVLKCIKKEIKSYQKRRVIVYHYIKQFVFDSHKMEYRVQMEICNKKKSLHEIIAYDVCRISTYKVKENMFNCIDIIELKIML